MAYGSKLYVGMALKNNGGHIKVVLNLADSHFIYSHFAYTKLVFVSFRLLNLKMFYVGFECFESVAWGAILYQKQLSCRVDRY